MLWRLAACAGALSHSLVVLVLLVVDVAGLSRRAGTACGCRLVARRFVSEVGQRLTLRQNKWVLVTSRAKLFFLDARCVARCAFACVGWQRE